MTLTEAVRELVKLKELEQKLPEKPKEFQWVTPWFQVPPITHPNQIFLTVLP